MSLAAKKQRRGSNAPDVLNKTVERFPPSQEWLMNLAMFPIRVASMFILKQACPEGRCSRMTKRAELKDCVDLSLS